jgi:hypothetical protein
MPLFVRIDPEKRLVVVAGYGTLTDDEVFAYERDYARRSDTIGFDELADLSHVTGITLPSTDRVGDLVTEAAGKDALRGTNKLAIVAPGDLAYGLGRMFQTRRELDSRSTKIVGVFRTMAEAIVFLGLDHEPALPK